MFTWDSRGVIDLLASVDVKQQSRSGLSQLKRFCIKLSSGVSRIKLKGEPVWPSGNHSSSKCPKYVRRTNIRPVKNGLKASGKRKDLGSIPLRLSFLFKKVVVCGHCLVTLSIISY